MANLKLIHSKHNAYKIITNSSKPHPALLLIAELLKESNKHSEIKIGVFSVTGGLFTPFINVKSWTSGKQQRMNKKQYYEWMAGKRQISGYISVKKQWKSEELDINKILEEVNEAN